jgi:transcriptional regulator with XRE-family HTH domain
MTTNFKKKNLQRAAGLLQRSQLASRLGVSDSQLDAWLRGDLTMPDGKLLVLAAILDAEPEGQ